MKILALVTDAYEGFGGIAQYNRDFLTALSHCNESSKIIVLPRSKTASLTVSEKIHQARGTFSPLAYSWHAFHISAKNSFDVIFCGHLYMLPLAILLGKIKKTPIWLQIHGIDAWEKPSRLLQKLIGNCQLVTSVSRYTKKRFLQWANLPPEKVKVLPNTVEAHFTLGEKPLNLLTRYQLTGKKILLTVGRLAANEAYKGHDRVIRVLPKVLAQHPEVVYLIVGSGDDEMRLKNLAKEYKIQQAVYFLGKVANEELVEHYQLADVYVMPSSKEGFGIVFLQAAACGLPVIAGNQDGSKDALLDGRLGILINPDDEEALFTAIDQCLQGKKMISAEVSLFNKQNFTALVSELLNLIPKKNNKLTC